jgi:hypothetical protein
VVRPVRGAPRRRAAAAAGRSSGRGAAAAGDEARRPGGDPGWTGPPADDAAGAGPVVAAYLDLFAPASAADVAGFLGTSVSAARPALPTDLVPVVVAGRSALCPPALLDELTGPAPEPAGTVRLLPPSDPYLQGRDRECSSPGRSTGR